MGGRDKTSQPVLRGVFPTSPQRGQWELWVSEVPGQILTVSGTGAPTWSNAGGNVNFWQLNNGALSPFNTTNDLLLGSTSTSSARFAFTNVVGPGTPTASISGGVNGGNLSYRPGNNGNNC